MPLSSRYYVLRPTDAAFRQALDRQDSLILVKGPRQTGKSSLLARGLGHAREAGRRVVFTDLQMLTGEQMTSLDTFLLALAGCLAEQLDLDTMPREAWDPGWSPTLNFRRFLRRVVLGAGEGPLVWGLDEIDRLFTCEFGGDVFGLFRSWHNERALNPACPWGRLTLAMAYATEAHLFVSDLNQSPFNVGTRLSVGDFTPDQIAALHAQYGSPLRRPGELARLMALVGGHPYLVRRALHELALEKEELSTLEKQAARGGGPFEDHLRRLRVALGRDPAMSAAMREVLRGRPCPSEEAFFRLRSAGLLAGESPEEARPRCRLYACYLERQLAK